MSYSKFRSINRIFPQVDVSFVSLDYMVICAVFDLIRLVFRKCRTRVTLTVLDPETENMIENRTCESIKLSTVTLFTMQNTKLIK